MIPVNPKLNLNQVLAVATENLQAQGCEVVATPMSAASASMTLRKDRDGFKNYLGHGVESRVQMMVNNTAMTLSIEHEWTNKSNDAVMLGCNSSPNGAQANPQYGDQPPQDVQQPYQGDNQ